MYARSPIGLSRSSLTFVVALHAAAVWGVLQARPVTLPAPLAVLSVGLLLPAEVIRPMPEIAPPRPKPIERRPTPVEQPTQIAARADSPAPTPIALPRAPTPAAPPALVAMAPVAALSQPRFDADYLDNPTPPYPAISRRLSEQGRVVLRVQVDADGRAAEVQLQSTSGSSRLDQSALDTVRHWKFIPAKLGKEAIAAWVLVPIAFTLKD